jgi:hypothetical protein
MTQRRFAGFGSPEHEGDQLTKLPGSQINVPFEHSSFGFDSGFWFRHSGFPASERSESKGKGEMVR